MYSKSTDKSYEHAAVVNPDGSVGVLEAEGGALLSSPHHSAPPMPGPGYQPAPQYGYPGPYGMPGPSAMATRLVVACPRCRAHIMPPPLPPGSSLFACTCGQRMTLPPGYNHMGPIPQQAPQTYTVSTGPGGVSVMFVPPGYTASAPAPPSTMSYTAPSHVPMTGSGGAPAATGKGGFMPPVSLPSAPSRTGYSPVPTSAVATASTAGPPAMYSGHPAGGTVVSCGHCRTNMLAHTDVVLCPTCGMRVERGPASVPTMTVNPYAKPQ